MASNRTWQPAGDEYKWLCARCFFSASHEGTCVKTIANNFDRKCAACGLRATHLCDPTTVSAFLNGGVIGPSGPPGKGATGPS